MRPAPSSAICTDAASRRTAEVRLAGTFQFRFPKRVKLTGADSVVFVGTPSTEQHKRFIHLHWDRSHMPDHVSSAALRRGRPNTVAVGLPVPNRRSLDRSLPVPVRHSSQKQIFVVSPSAIDTSPIAKVTATRRSQSFTQLCLPVCALTHISAHDTQTHIHPSLATQLLSHLNSASIVPSALTHQSPNAMNLSGQTPIQVKQLSQRRRIYLLLEVAPASLSHVTRFSPTRWGRWRRTS